jgi:predicted nuclease of predicted toxin-antitoxin system
MIRFLADASLRHAIVAGCLRREPAIDFLSAHLARLEGLSDPDVLAIAAEQNRILVTHDFRTMPEHFAEFLEARGSSPGVFLVKQRTPLAQVIEALVLVWSASEPNEWTNRVLEMPLR